MNGHAPRRRAPARQWRARHAAQAIEPRGGGDTASLKTRPGPPVRPPHRFLAFGAPAIEDAEIAEVVDSLRTGWLGTGPKVARFERAFEAHAGRGHAIAVNSCTAALHLSLIGCRLEPGDEVITTAMTFCATVNAIIHAGGVPVLADVDPETMNIDPAHAEALVGPRTRAILPVHFAGRPCDMDALSGICDRHGLALVEDCAHAVEAEYRGQPTGTFGRFGCFSFYVTKNVVTGEGGMVLAREADDADRLRTLALHGMSRDAWQRFSEAGYRHYEVVEAGFKYNMMDLQAAIGLHQLGRVEANWRRRRDVWQRYMEAFADLPVGLPAPAPSADRHAHHLFTVLVDEARAGLGRDAFLEALAAHNIGAGVHYVSVPDHRYYQERFGWRPEDWPNAMRIGRQTVSLPLSARLAAADVADVIEAVRRIVGR